MRKTLKDFYYGNLTPGDQDMAVGSELKRAVDRITRCEQHLTERLGEPEQLLLNELISAQHIADSITAEENFILGFRLGVRIMAECMDGNDGDIRSGGEKNRQNRSRWDAAGALRRTEKAGGGGQPVCSRLYPFTFVGTYWKEVTAESPPPGKK